MQFCLVAAGIVAHLGTAALTLGWTHSIEKTRWEEDYHVTPAGIVLIEDRIQGTGAGMEPPPNAKFDGTWWRYQPHLPPQQEIVLRRSGATADWSVCIEGKCRLMSAYVGEKADPVTMKPCS